MATSAQYGAFIPTNFLFDAQQLNEVKNIDPLLRELLVKLYQNINQMALITNISDKGQYAVSEFVNGQQWFPNPANTSATAAVPTNRQVCRYVVNFGALPNTATKQATTQIILTTGYRFTRIYGCASDPVNFRYIPLPYSSATAVASNIELFVDSVVVGPNRFARVNVITGANYSAFTTTYIVLEYIKS